MQRLLQRIDHQVPALLGIGLLLIGLLFSRAMMSIGMIVLAVNSVVNRGVAANFRTFLRRPDLLGLTGIFLLYLLSGLNSENLDYWLDRLCMKLPFLFLPFAFLSMPRFPVRTYYTLLALFFWLVVPMALYSLGQFLGNLEDITYLYREGKVMPTPVPHTRWSLMVAFAVAVGWYLFQKGFYWRFRAERYAMLAAGLLLVIYLHLLAVRSGLVALYTVLGYFLIVEVVRHRRWALALGVAAVLSLSLVLSYRYIPTLKNKIDYTIYGVRLFRQNGNMADLSDSFRLGSIEAGLTIGNRHPLAGVGIGDLRDACERFYQERYPALAGYELLPHNQYVLVYAATGGFGLLFFIAATFYPLFCRRAWRDVLFVALHLIVFLSFMVEPTAETQLGTAFYLLFLLMGMSYIARNQKEGQAA